MFRVMTYADEVKHRAWLDLSFSKKRFRHPELIRIANARYSDFVAWADQVGIPYFLDMNDATLGIVRVVGTTAIPVRFIRKSDAVAAKLAFGGA